MYQFTKSLYRYNPNEYITWKRNYMHVYPRSGGTGTLLSLVTYIGPNTSSVASEMSLQSYESRVDYHGKNVISTIATSIATS